MNKVILNCPNLLNNFEVIKTIGLGGMGEVFLANDKRLERNVAVKVLNLPYDSSLENRELITRFKTEAKAIAKLQHPNIISIFDIGEENNHYYMIMEYIEGTNLEKLIRSNMLPDLNFINAVTLQICNALEYAHQNNLIHRDIKPANIILMSNNMIKLVDFGIAQLNKSNIEEQKITANGTLLGSIAYISPEQLLDASTVDFKSDIYSLGVTIYELITGQLPFLANTSANLITKIMTEKAVPLHKINPSIPESFSQIISKAMEKNPDNRFRNITEMKKEISSLVDKGTFFNLALPSTQDEKNIKNGTSELNKNTRTLNKNYLNTFNTGLANTKDKIFEFLKVSNYLWVNFLLNDIKSIETTLDINKLKDKLKEPDLNGKYFSGVVLINEDIFIFVYEGCFVGALNTKKLIKGQDVFNSLPVFDVKISLKPLDDKNKYLPIIISNILELNGEKLQENLDSSIIDLLPMINDITSEKEKFTGYIICRKTFDFSINKTKILLVGKMDSLNKIQEILNLQSNIYDFKFCTNISQLQQELKRNKYDCIISDFEMEDKITVELFKDFKDQLYLFSDNIVDENIKFTLDNEEIKIYAINKSFNILEMTKNIESYIQEQSLKNKNVHKNENQDESYIFAFSEGKSLFSLLIGEQIIPSIIDNTIEDIFNNGYFSVSIYKSKLSMLKENLHSLLPSINALIDFKDINEVNFSALSTFKDREIPKFISDAFKDNVFIDYKCNHLFKVNYLSEEIDLLKDIKNTNFNKISNWIVKDLFFHINQQSMMPLFKNLYSKIPNIKHFNFTHKLKGEDRTHLFDVVAYDEHKNPILLINFGKDSLEDFNDFIEKSIQVQKNLHKNKKNGLDAALFISNNISKQLISSCLSKTKSRSFFSKEKNIIKVNSGEGFQVLLLRENNLEDNHFSILSPEVN